MEFSGYRVQRTERALSLAKHAAACTEAMTALSVNKHKSWYFHLVTWVVPLQMAEVGDLWPFGTGPVEQRGARLKRLARSVVSWRPYHSGYKQSSEDPSVQVFCKRRRYDSCAMMQLLRACVAQERQWDPVYGEEIVLSTTERRLIQRGRLNLIKEDIGHRLPRIKQELEEVVDLTMD